MATGRAPHPLAAMWIYSALRIAVFLVLFLILLLLGVQGLLAALIAVALSVPISYVALQRPRARLAAAMQDRMGQRREKLDELESELSGETPPREDD